MTIQWSIFLLALGLLLPPPLLSSSLRRAVMKPRRFVVQPGALMGRWQNWVDLIRAAVGAYLLAHVAIQITPGVKGAGMKAMFVEGAVLAVAVLVQSVRISPGVQLIAPIFYLSGLTAVLPGYTTGCFAVFVGWLFAIGGKNAAYQLPAMGVALAAAGYVLGLSLSLILTCGLILPPLMAGFLFQKPLAYVSGEASTMTSTANTSKPTAASELEQ